ncbi:hypothetical protein [Winogradskyella costae]|uniref:hypothetical protein n=1 Tax=Winogradskyella costae TaxID=2697008 RepID=UPI0015CD39DE|nr:hypothetical protein [Winogradskyella costae]
MKTKLNIGLFVLFLAFLGTYLEQNILPNQQIVVQFSDSEISSEDAEIAIEAIQNQLQNIGVTHIEIGQNNEGQLRITYYSNTHVKYIQNALFNVETLKVDYNSAHKQSNNFPEHKNLKDYELNISEIKTNDTINWDFERAQVVEVNQKIDRLSNSKTNNFGNQFSAIEINYSIRVATAITNDAIVSIDTISYIIPEVRAGPIA